MPQKAGSDGSISWESSIRNSFASQLKALVVPSDTKDYGVGKCSIEVWAEDDGDELAYCRGIVCPRDDRAIVLWLGRSDSRTVHPRIRGRRCVGNAKAPNGLKYTVAEAIFGVVITIASMFGVSIIELQAKDNGSGRLVELYEKLGFVKRPQNPGEIAWMEAPIVEAAQIAPAEWLSSLVPQDFKANDWLHDAVMSQRLRRSLQTLFGNPPRYAVAWPMGSRVETKINPTHSGSFDSGTIRSVVLEAALLDAYGETLAWAKANVHFENRFCRLLWLGRQRGQPLHKTVRGRRMYSVRSSSSADTEPKSDEMVTTAIGLVGVIASFSLWLGAKVMHMQSLDNGSGKLVAYFRSFGFEAVEGGSKDVLTAPCDAVVQRCCPEAWLPEMPAGTWADGAPEFGRSRPATVKSKSSLADGPSLQRTTSLPTTQITSDNRDENCRRASSKSAQLTLPALSRPSTPCDENALQALPMTPSTKEKQRLTRPQSTSPFIKALRHKNSLQRRVPALSDASDQVIFPTVLVDRPDTATEIRHARHDFVTNFGSQRLTFLDDVSRDRSRNDRLTAGDPLGPLKELARKRWGS